MSQNRSSAVMQRDNEPHDSLGDFPTPCWATRALCEWIGESTLPLTCREPAANRGHMVKALKEYFWHVEASDIFDYGAGYPQNDFLFGPLPGMIDWTITNPPFRLAEQFIQRALETSETGVAMIVRTAFLEGVDRHHRLFSTSPPTDVLQFTERVVMHKGEIKNPNIAIPTWSKKHHDWVMRKPSTATSYCWLVWRQEFRKSSPFLHWIAPCRKRLERAEDYQ